MGNRMVTGALSGVRSRSIGLAALLLAVSAVAAQAQTALTLGTGFGVTIPVGDAADFVSTGWHAQANLGLTNPDWPVGVRLDGMYHTLGGKDLGAGLESAGLDVIAGTLNLQLFLSRNVSGGGFFVTGGGGFYNLDFGDDDGLIESASVTKAGILGGLGYKFGMTNLRLALEGKFHHIFTENSATQLIPITILVEIPMGGN